MAKSPRGGNENPEVRRLRAQVHQLLLAKRQRLAEPLVRQLLALTPNDANAHRQLAGCLMSQRRLDEAIDVARAAVALDPTLPAAWATLAAVESTRGDGDAAAAAYQRALQVRPGYPPAVFGFAAVLVDQGRWAEALDWAERGLAARPDHAGLHRIRGQALAAVGRTDEAVAAMGQFLRLAPDEAESHRAAAVILRRAGRTAEAADAAERAVALDPANPARHNHLAMLRLQERRLDDADRHYRAAGEIVGGRRDGQKGPAAIEAFALNGQAHVNLKRRRFAAAEAQFRRVLELDPTHHTAAALLALTVGVQYRFDEAMDLARHAASLAPAAGGPMRILASILAMVERFDEAIAQATVAVERFPDSAESRRVLAAIYIATEDYARAYECAAEAVTREPSMVNRRVRAVALAGLGRTAEAIAAIGDALDAEADTYYAHESAGYVYYLLGDQSRAETHLLRAMELDESGLGGHGSLGLVYAAQGRPAEARSLLEKSLAMNPHQRRVRTALAGLAGGSDG